MTSPSPMNHDALLPCPHCGEADELYPAYRVDKDGNCHSPYAIDCLGCGSDFTPRPGADLFAAWNRRTLPSVSPEPAGDGLVERDIHEVANQLAGYIDPGTPEPLAAFLWRESREAEKLATRITALQAEVAKLTKERDEARVNKADLVYMAKLIKKLRSKFINIADHVEDEGDRAYFGSSNDADDFIQAVRDLDDANWSLILDKAKGRDLYAEMRKLRSALAKSEASREAAEARVAEAVKVISDLICTNPYQPQKAAEAARTWMEGGR